MTVCLGVHNRLTWLTVLHVAGPFYVKLPCILADLLCSTQHGLRAYGRQLRCGGNMASQGTCPRSFYFVLNEKAYNCCVNFADVNGRSCRFKLRHKVGGTNCMQDIVSHGGTPRQAQTKNHNAPTSTSTQHESDAAEQRRFSSIASSAGANFACHWQPGWQSSTSFE
jgi:hypothetical protein